MVLPVFPLAVLVLLTVAAARVVGVAPPPRRSRGRAPPPEIGLHRSIQQEVAVPPRGALGQPEPRLPGRRRPERQRPQLDLDIAHEQPRRAGQRRDAQLEPAEPQLAAAERR